jgi:hypothetical protein
MSAMNIIIEILTPNVLGISGLLTKILDILKSLLLSHVTLILANVY